MERNRDEGKGRRLPSSPEERRVTGIYANLLAAVAIAVDVICVAMALTTLARAIGLLRNTRPAPHRGEFAKYSEDKRLSGLRRAARIGVTLACCLLSSTVAVWLTSALLRHFTSAR
jgi:hypothetical protein